MPVAQACRAQSVNMSEPLSDILPAFFVKLKSLLGAKRVCRSIRPSPFSCLTPNSGDVSPIKVTGLSFTAPPRDRSGLTTSTSPRRKASRKFPGKRRVGSAATSFPDDTVSGTSMPVSGWEPRLRESRHSETT